MISGRQLPKKYLKVFLSTEIVAGCQAAAEQRIVTHLSKSLMERCKTQKLNCIKKREIKETTVGGAFIKSNFIPASFCWVLAEAVAVGQHLGNRLYFNPVNFTHTSFFFFLPGSHFLLRERLGCLYNEGDRKKTRLHFTA